jgi:G:T-mismatch repair DNA endonuclease (very short patch repair protein)
MIQCKLCGKEFKDRRVFGMHLSRTEKDKFNSDLEKEVYLVETLFGKEYVNQIIEKYKNGLLCIYDITSSGKDISKCIILMGLKRTSKEERKTNRYKEKYLQGIQKKYGTNITNISQIPGVQQKKERRYAKKHGSYENYLAYCRSKMNIGYNEYVGTEKHKETIVKTGNTCESRYGIRNFGSSESAKQKAQAKRKETIAQWDYQERLERTSIARAAVRHRGGYSSMPEKRVRHCLTELDIVFTANEHLWHYNYDMVFDNFIVEVQGDMWHGNPNKYKETDLIMGKIIVKDLWAKDKRKKEKAESNGYTVIAIWECDIVKKNDEDLINFVKSKLEENGYVFN